ncbi:hypothetical protein Glove_595g10 [Diversispora epigaea]|uniref:Protein kinase domain-containing protein n=1 Tax=Diversispora epigaea TaxID=1348612 RepID=A0A397GDJ4_9GLOM|nr:hypothetical protein Glove_595g10 [Diversispora epigaea]
MIFKTRKPDGSDEFIKCKKCNIRKRINCLHLCKRCNAMSLQIVDSGNKIIDDFIKETQFKKSASDFLKWVPYENLKNVEHIGRGGFSQIYKATWEKQRYLKYNGTFKTEKTEVVLKVLNDSESVDAKFFKELKYTYQLWDGWGVTSIQCYGVTQIPKTKNYAFILEYAKGGDLHHFLNKNFAEMKWMKKIDFLRDMVKGIKKIHNKKILHRDLHSGNILITHSVVISDLGFSQPATIKSNLSRDSQIYGIIPYMAPELFKGQPYSYASDIYSLGMIMWQMTSGHRPFHDQNHGPKLILDILDGKRPEITEDTPKCWTNLMKRCWHSVPSQRPTIREIYMSYFSSSYNSYSEYSIKKFYPDKYNDWLEINEAEKKRLEMIESKKPFVKNPGYEHPGSRYYSVLLNSMLESINSKVSDLFSNDNLFSNDHFDINSNQINENPGGNSSAENSKKHFLDESLQEDDQRIVKDSSRWIPFKENRARWFQSNFKETGKINRGISHKGINGQKEIALRQ